MIREYGLATASGRHTLDVDLVSLGLSIIPDFISLEEEAHLMSFMKVSVPNKTKTRNSIRRFGSTKPYRGSIISKEIPTYFEFVLDRIMERNLLPFRPNSVSVNEYYKGQEIAAHIDSVASGQIISILSLLSDATMKFSKKKKMEATILIPARSLVQMRGEIRNDWMHAILPVEAQRYSVVFRCAPN